MADSQNIREQKELLQLQQKEFEGRQNLSAEEQKSLNTIKSQIKELNRLLAVENKRQQVNQDINKEFASFANEFKKLSPSVKQQLGSTKEMSGVYAQLTTRAAREAAIAKNNNGVVKQNAEVRKEALENAKNTLTQQASAAAQAQDELLGISQYERERLDLESRRSELGNDNVDALIAASRQTELLSKKTEILQGMNDSLPGPIKQMLGFAKKLRAAFVAGMGPLFLLGAVLAAAIKSFTSLDEGAKSFRETTGLTNSQMEGIKSQANDITGQFGSMGVNAEKVFNTVAALKSEFSDVANFGDEVVAGLTLLNTNFGVSAESAAKVQGVFEQIGGLTSETATGVQLQVANMAKLAGVAPAKVFEDIAENAEIASTLFQGDVESLTKAAIQARRLGTNLKSVASTTEHLLDFQSNIGDELVAATFVGGQFNLTQARSLAASGKTIEAQKEVLRQLQRSGDFRKQDYFTQQQLAKAAGMSVEEINKQLNAQEKLNSLSSEQRALADKAIEQGLDISNIDKEQLASQVEQFSKQQEQQAQLEKLQNAFMGIASTVGSVLTPLLEGLMPILQMLLFPVQLIADGFKFFADNLALAIPLAAGLAIAFAPAIIAAISSAVGFIMSTFAMIPLGLGIPLGIAAVAGLFSMVSKAKSVSQVGDLAIDPNGGPIVSSPKEGGLFQGTKNDGLMMAPGIGASTFSNSEVGANVLSNSEVGANVLSNNDGNVVNINMDSVVNELKSLKEAFSKNKDVYMDGRLVTSNVERSVDKSTKNNYGLV